MANIIRKPYINEKSLFIYVKEYMDEKEELKEKINSDSMTEHLIETIAAFNRKKFRFFKESVGKVYKYEKQLRAAAIKEDKIKSEVDTNGISTDSTNGLPTSTEKTLSDDTKKNTRKKRKRSPSRDECSDTSKSNPGYQVFESFIIFEEVITIPKESALRKKIMNIMDNLNEILIKRKPKRNLLLSGPAGSGKTFLVQAIANVARVPVISLDAKVLVALDSNVKIIDNAFAEATKKAHCIFHISNLEVLASSSSKEIKAQEHRLSSKITTLIHELNTVKRNELILVIGECSYHPSKSLSSSVKNIFEEHIFLPPLDNNQRLQFLQKFCVNLNLKTDLELIVERTPSYVANDIRKLVDKTINCARDRSIKHLQTESMSMEEAIQLRIENHKEESQLEILDEDFFNAMQEIIPVLKQDGFPSVPEVRMDDIGGLEDVKEQIYKSIFLSVENKESLKDFYKNESSGGVLLWGPPGNGKTLLAKAVANQAGVNFILKSGAEILNMYQGESERNIREAFALARSVSPCVLYFDEFETICPSRSTGAESGSKSTIVTSLLSELDGVNSREGVYVLASTNRPDIIDEALRRPGRFETSIYIGLPNAKERKSIFLAASSNGTLPKFASDVDLDILSEQCLNYSGADCAQLLKEAVQYVFYNTDRKKQIGVSKENGTLYWEDLQQALGSMQPSVSEEVLKKCQKILQKDGKRKMKPFTVSSEENMDTSKH